MEIPIKKAIILADGLHEGVIINIRYRQKPYSYVDLEIQLKQGEDIIDLKVGYPQVVSKASKLGNLLERFGAILDGETSIDPDKVLIGKKVRFTTATTINEKGKFPMIIPDTVNPADGWQSSL